MIAGTSSDPQRNACPPPPQHDRAADREEQRRVVRDQTEPRHPSLPVLTRVERHHVERPEEAPRPADAREHDHGHARRVVLDVRRGRDGGSALDTCDWSPGGRVAGARLPSVQKPDRRAVVHRIAVRAGQREAVVRRDERRVVEAGEVEARPTARSTTSAVTTATRACLPRVAHGSGNVHATTIASNGTSSTNSTRASVARPHSAPSAAARRNVGRSASRNAAQHRADDREPGERSPTSRARR